MKRSLILAFDVFLLLSAIGCSFLSFFAIHQNIQVTRVVSDSMAPAIHRGDTLIFRSEPTESISEGKILLLPLADGSGQSYVHRVVTNIENADSSVTVITKGDANPVADNWKLKITSPSVPVYVATIPTKLIPLFPLNNWILLALFSGIILLFVRVIFFTKTNEMSADHE